MKLRSRLNRVGYALVAQLLRLRGIKVGRGCQISFRARLDTPFGGHIVVGDRCLIHHDAIIHTYGGNIEIGDDVSINPMVVIYGHGGTKIGNGVRIATQTVLIPSNHNHERLDIPIFQQGETSVGIVIGNDVWIGAGVKVLDGVRIADGCVIGAGSVVSRSTEPFGVYVGVPAKLIRSRREAPS